MDGNDYIVHDGSYICNSCIYEHIEYLFDTDEIDYADCSKGKMPNDVGTSCPYYQPIESYYPS